MASSQARAGVEKYAATGSTSVSQTPYTREARPRPASTQKTVCLRQRLLLDAGAAAAAATGQPDAAQQDQRPDEVELLLDRQRPVVLQRGGALLLGEVVGADRGEVDVGREERHPHRVGDHVERVHDAEPEQRGDHCGDRHQGGGGQDPAGPAGVEVADRQVAAALDLAEEQLGDQEAGDHEEDVHPDEAAGEERNTGMARDHGQHGDRTEPLDVSAEGRLSLGVHGPCRLPAGSACIAFREEARGNARCLPGVEPAEAD